MVESCTKKPSEQEKTGEPVQASREQKSSDDVAVLTGLIQTDVAPPAAARPLPQDQVDDQEVSASAEKIASLSINGESSAARDAGGPPVVASSTGTSTGNAAVDAALAAVAASAAPPAGAGADGEDDEDEEDDADRIDAMFEKLRDLLRDAGRFHDLCEQGHASQGGKLETPQKLQAALNVICHDVGTPSMEDVTLEEAEDLFIEDLNTFEFYQLAKPFFESIARTLDEENTTLIIPGSGVAVNINEVNM